MAHSGYRSSFHRIPLLVAGVAAVASLALLLAEPTEARPSGAPQPAASIQEGNQPPRVSLIFGPRPALAGQEIHFDATAVDPEGDEPLTYEWHLNGGPMPGAENSPNVVWVADGLWDHSFWLKVTDSKGAATMVTDTLLVVERGENAPWTDLYVNPDTAELGTRVKMQAVAGEGEQNTPFSYQWSVDGNDPWTGGPEFDWDALSEGEHTATVTVVDARGASTTLNSKLVVIPAQDRSPRAQMQFGPSPAEEGATVSFKASPVADAENDLPFSYSWSLDGAPIPGAENAESATWIASSIGRHTVKVTVTDSNGKSAILANPVFVTKTLPKPEPTPQPTPQPTPTAQPAPVPTQAAIPTPPPAPSAAVTPAATPGQAR